MIEPPYDRSLRAFFFSDTIGFPLLLSGQFLFFSLGKRALTHEVFFRYLLSNHVLTLSLLNHSPDSRQMTFRLSFSPLSLDRVVSTSTKVNSPLESMAAMLLFHGPVKKIFYKSESNGMVDRFLVDNRLPIPS